MNNLSKFLFASFRKNDFFSFKTKNDILYRSPAPCLTFTRSNFGSIQLQINLVNGFTRTLLPLDSLKCWELKRIFYDLAFKVTEAIVRQSTLLTRLE